MAPYAAENQGLSKHRPPLAIRREPISPPATKPTIRVIHIFAPKVIKTDTANFRATVQKLTGRSTKKSRTARSTKPPSPPAPHVHPAPSPELHWVHSPEDLILHRLVGDACTSIDSSSTDSKDTGDASSFSFYAPAHRESAYSLGEIPAPFFGAEMATPTALMSSYDHLPAPAAVPSPHVMDPGLLSFDVDSLGSGLGSPLPLSEHPGGACDVPFLYLEVVAPRSVGGCMIC